MAPALLRVANSLHTATPASNPHTKLIQPSEVGTAAGQPPAAAFVVAVASRTSASASIAHAMRQVRLWLPACKASPSVSALSAATAVIAVERNGAAIATRRTTAIEMTAATERVVQRPLPGRLL